jgi:hypothetical protein
MNWLHETDNQSFIRQYGAVYSDLDSLLAMVL